jgi:hypothetical protein
VRPLRTALLIVCQLIPSLALSACGTTSGLDVRYADASAHLAMLASVPPRRVLVAPVADQRADTARIGVKPTRRENVITARPVTEILREALIIELAKNGHAVVGDRPDVVLAPQVDEFWLDAVDGYTKTQYVGRVAIALTLSDARTGAALVTRRYVGIRRGEGEPKSEDTWRDVMNVALLRAMHDVATDLELISALGRTATTDRVELSPYENVDGIPR